MHQCVLADLSVVGGRVSGGECAAWPSMTRTGDRCRVDLTSDAARVASLPPDINESESWYCDESVFDIDLHILSTSKLGR